MRWAVPPKSNSNCSKLSTTSLQRRNISFCTEVSASQRGSHTPVTVKRLTSSLIEQSAKSIHSCPPVLRTSVGPTALWANSDVWALCPVEYTSALCFCPSHSPCSSYNGDIDWSLTRPQQTHFAVIMNERCQWWSISFQIFLHIVNISFHKRDWVPNGLQS